MSSVTFQKENIKKHKKRTEMGELSKKGGALESFLGKPACLGENGGKHLPPSLKKMVSGSP